MPRLRGEDAQLKTIKGELETSGGVVHIGETGLLKFLTRELTTSQSKFPNAAAQIAREEPDDQDLAYMAKELVQCTLPHRDAFVRPPGRFLFGPVPTAM